MFFSSLTVKRYASCDFLEEKGFGFLEAFELFYDFIGDCEFQQRGEENSDHTAEVEPFSDR
jgi:hypothetical protein